MFKILLTIFLLGLALVPAYATQDTKAGPACELCELVLTAAESQIKKNASEAQVIAFIDKELCARLGPLSSLCVQFVNSSGAQIIEELISGLNVSTICSKFGLCSSLSFKKQLKHSKQSASKPEKRMRMAEIKKDVKASTLNCTICKLVMTQIENLLTQNASQAQIIQYIDEHVCKPLGPLDAICESLMNTYGPQAIKLLANKVDPEKVCEVIGMCTNKTAVFYSRQKDSKEKMLGRKNLKKEKLAKAQTPIKSRKSELKANPLECEACQYVLQFLENEIKNNKTETAIVNALDAVCIIAPSSVREKCVDLVKTYGIYLVQLLIEFADPLHACQSIKLC